MDRTRTNKPTMKLNGQLLTPSDIGDVNRSRVLQAFCDYGPLTRADLAKMAGVTRATIGNIVADLVDAGLIEEGEPRSSTGRVGKPGRPLWFGPRAGLTAAVALGPGHLDAALVNARGESLAEFASDFDPSDRTDAIEAIARALRDVLPESRDEVLGIGIAVPGVCDTSTGEVLGSGQLPGLANTALADAVMQKSGARVLIDNDSRAQALGEKWFGAGKQVPSFASIQTGHGIGVGLVLGGVIMRGPRGEAGEAGHTTVVRDGELCVCGLHGCWETIATLRWLRAEAAHCGVGDPSTLDARRLGSLAADGDAAAAELMRRYAANLATGLANLTLLLTPALIIVHGDVVGGGEVLRDMVAEETRARVLPHMRGGIEIVLSDLDQRAGLLGAAGLVLSETFHLAI